MEFLWEFAIFLFLFIGVLKWSGYFLWSFTWWLNDYFLAKDPGLVSKLVNVDAAGNYRSVLPLLENLKKLKDEIAINYYYMF